MCRVSLALCLLIYCFPLASSASDADLQIVADTGPRSQVPAFVLSERSATIDVSRLPQTIDPENPHAVSLDLGELQLTTHLFESRRSRSGRIWVGTIVGDPHGRVILAGRDGVVHGTIRTDGRLFELRRVEGTTVVQEIDESSSLLQEEYPIEVALGGLQPPAVQTTPDAATSSSPEIIDVMVVYTEGAKISAGGTDADIESRIALGIAEANLSYQNSGIDLEVRLAHVAAVDYEESGDLGVDLPALRIAGDGLIDEIHAWRDEYAADIVHLITGSGGCGKAYVMSNVTPAFEAWAFAVTVEGCISPNYTFAHEMGHVQAARHDYDTDDTTGAPYEFNHGHYAPSGQWRTVMSYNNCSSGPCRRELYWSNPDLEHPVTQERMGRGDAHPQPANNARTLNATAATVAAFRQPGAFFADGFETGDISRWGNP